jgi:hypothetical protein
MDDTTYLISHLTQFDKAWLIGKINNPGRYNIPTMDEIIDYLESTPDDEPSEIEMGDLVIYYDESNYLGFDLNII